MDTIGERCFGFSVKGLERWAFGFMTLDMVGQCIFRNGLLQMDRFSGEQLVSVIQNSPNGMTYAVLALLLRAAATCAIPVLAYLLVTFFQHWDSCGMLLFKIGLAASISELPYNLAVSGKLLDTTRQNPLFALAAALVILYLFSIFREKNWGTVFARICIGLAGVIGCQALHIDDGIPLVVLCCIFWHFREGETKCTLAAAIGAAACCVFSPYYLVSPMGVLLVHFHRSEENEEGSRGNILWLYPAVLLGCWAAASFVL